MWIKSVVPDRLKGIKCHNSFLDLAANILILVNNCHYLLNCWHFLECFNSMVSIHSKVGVGKVFINEIFFKL